MVRVEPMLGRREEKAADFVTPVVEDEALPVGMEAEAGIGVLEEVGPVELRQREVVRGEVGGHPVQDHPDVGAVEAVDQRHEVLRVAVAAGRREVTGRLIAPGSVERMLHQGQELDVGEPATLDVLDERVGQLVVAEESSGVRRITSPASEMDLVDRDGRVEPGAPPPRGHPVTVTPLVREVPDHRSRAGRHLGAPRERVGLVEDRSLLRRDGELVHLARARLGNRSLPDPRDAPGLQGVRARVPRVEVADDAHASRVRRPDGEADSAVGLGMRTQLAVRGSDGCPR